MVLAGASAFWEEHPFVRCAFRTAYVPALPRLVRWNRLFATTKENIHKEKVTKRNPPRVSEGSSCEVVLQGSLYHIIKGIEINKCKWIRWFGNFPHPLGYLAGLPHNLHFELWAKTPLWWKQFPWGSCWEVPDGARKFFERCGLSELRAFITGQVVEGEYSPIFWVFNFPGINLSKMFSQFVLTCLLDKPGLLAKSFPTQKWVGQFDGIALGAATKHII